MDTNKTISTLQCLATQLSTQAYAHTIQGKMFGAQGLEKLATKYAGHGTEEQGYADQFIDRIIDLGATPEVQPRESAPLFKDVVEFLKHDLQVSRDGIEMLRGLMEQLRADVTTYDLLKVYLKDEEEDMFWTESQLELIELIGIQNWLVRQL